MISIEKLKKNSSLNYYILQKDDEILDIFRENPEYPIDLVSKVYYTVNGSFNVEILLDLEEVDSQIVSNIREIEIGKWWKKKIEKVVNYYPDFHLTFSSNIKLGIISKYLEEYEPNRYRLKKEYIGKIWRRDIYFFEFYLYCLNLLDWPDIDYWAEQTLKRYDTDK